MASFAAPDGFGALAKDLMQIQLVNPGSATGTTARIAAAARAFARPGTEIIALGCESAPASIEGPVEAALALRGLLEEIIHGEEQGVGGHVIASFDDPGLDAARALARAPVVGIGEAAFHIAGLVSGRFTVITTHLRTVPLIEHNLRRYGLDGRCARVRAAEVSLVALDDAHSAARDRISAEIDRAIREDRAEAIVLGMAGLVELARSLSVEHGLPVIEGVSAAVRLVEDLAALGLVTSKVGGWAPPRRKSLPTHFSGGG